MASNTRYIGVINLANQDGIAFHDAACNDYIIYGNQPDQRLLMGISNGDLPAMLGISTSNVLIQELDVASNVDIGRNLHVLGESTLIGTIYTSNVRSVDVGPLNMNGVLMSNDWVRANIDTSNIQTPGNKVNIVQATIENAKLSVNEIRTAQMHASNAYIYGRTEVSGDIVPTSNMIYDLGSLSNRFRDLYLSGSTIYLGPTVISVEESNYVKFFNSAASNPDSNLARLLIGEVQFGGGSSTVLAKIDEVTGKLNFYVQSSNGDAPVLSTPVPGLYTWCNENIGVGTSNPEERLAVAGGDISLANSNVDPNGKVVLRVLTGSNLRVMENMMVDSNVTSQTLNTTNMAVIQSAQVQSLAGNSVEMSNVTVSSDLRSLSWLYGQNASIQSASINMLNASNIGVSGVITSSNTLIGSNVYLTNLYANSVNMSNLTIESNLLSLSAFKGNALQASNVTLSNLYVPTFAALVQTQMSNVDASNVGITKLNTNNAFMSNVDVVYVMRSLNTFAASNASASNMFIGVNNVSLSYTSNAYTSNAYINGLAANNITACNVAMSNVGVTQTLTVLNTIGSNISASNGVFGTLAGTTVNLNNVSISNVNIGFAGITTLNSSNASVSNAYVNNAQIANLAASNASVAQTLVSACNLIGSNASVSNLTVSQVIISSSTLTGYNASVSNLTVTASSTQNQVNVIGTACNAVLYANVAGVSNLTVMSNLISLSSLAASNLSASNVVLNNVVENIVNASNITVSSNLRSLMGFKAMDYVQVNNVNVNIAESNYTTSNVFMLDPSSIVGRSNDVITSWDNLTRTGTYGVDLKEVGGPGNGRYVDLRSNAGIGNSNLSIGINTSNQFVMAFSFRVPSLLATTTDFIVINFDNNSNYSVTAKVTVNGATNDLTMVYNVLGTQNSTNMSGLVPGQWYYVALLKSYTSGNTPDIYLYESDVTYSVGQANFDYNTAINNLTSVVLQNKTSSTPIHVGNLFVYRSVLTLAQIQIILNFMKRRNTSCATSLLVGSNAVIGGYTPVTTDSILDVAGKTYTENLQVGTMSGTVGIGKMAVYALDVNGDINFSGVIRKDGTEYKGSQWITTSNNTAIYLNSSNIGVGTSNPSYPIDIVGGMGCSGILKIRRTPP